MSDLIERLRGKYVIPTTDGAGPLNGSMTFERQFQTSPIDHEAADALEAQAKRILELGAQIRALEADDLDFVPDENHTVSDMANVGHSLMQAIKEHCPTFSWNESPAEIIGVLMDDQPLRGRALTLALTAAKEQAK